MSENKKLTSSSDLQADAIDTSLGNSQVITYNFGLKL